MKKKTPLFRWIQRRLNGTRSFYNVSSNWETLVKKVLMYYYFDEMSMQDIADVLGFANTDTAKTKKYKCKKNWTI